MNEKKKKSTGEIDVFKTKEENAKPNFIKIYSYVYVYVISLLVSLAV